MEIRQVVGSLVCTHRVAGLGHWDLRLLQDTKGKHYVATDPVDARPGDWVFVVSGSAARYAMGDAGILTDLTIGGIIDRWEEERAAAVEPTAFGAARAA
ncbi:carboxysome peptide B [Thiocapsa marina]|uniref:Carboxysome peptide B n=1 Tax=Thiocapsa marina 5811 TaxID=768671 RepID=F9UIH0_9GAMM|nr:carboxysome peptide B [Thiocapsa marina]EGV15996.1 carboxysome peptide B [Thiocapsa marina 5811]